MRDVPVPNRNDFIVSWPQYSTKSTIETEEIRSSPLTAEHSRQISTAQGPLLPTDSHHKGPSARGPFGRAGQRSATRRTPAKYALQENQFLGGRNQAWQLGHAGLCGYDRSRVQLTVSGPRRIVPTKVYRSVPILLSRVLCLLVRIVIVA